MKWSEARVNHPNKWLLFEAVEAYSKNGERVVEDLAVINVFDKGQDALKRYAEKHKEDRQREMYVYHTSNKKLEIKERTWIGARRHG